MVERLFSAKLPLLRERPRVRGRDAQAPTLLINTENGIRTVHPKKTKTIYMHIYMISQHLNPRRLQPTQNGNYAPLLTKAVAPDRPFNKLHRGPG